MHCVDKVCIARIPHTVFSTVQYTARMNDKITCTPPEAHRITTDLFANDKNIDQSWRVFTILSEFVQGFDMLRKYGSAVTFMGSARTLPSDPYHQAATELACMLAGEGVTIVTGGGEGIMGAANFGAYRAGGKSIGFNIKLPMEQKLNPYVTESKTFHYFFSRKVMLAYASEVYVFFPGGYGTFDELLEVLTLVQTRKIERVPIVLYGAEYWNPLVDIFKNVLAKRGFINKEDLDLFVVRDTVDDAFAYIADSINNRAKKRSRSENEMPAHQPS